MAHRSQTGGRNSFQQTSLRLSHWGFEDSLGELWTPPTNTLPATDVAENVPVPRIIAQDTLAYVAEGTAASGSNTIFDLFNSPGSSVFRTQQRIGSGTMVGMPVVGDGVLEFKTDTRVLKDNNSLPGTTNGGAALKVYYSRFYVYMVGAPTAAATRLFVGEQSAANGGADIFAIRTGTTGTFSIADGTTFGSNSTRVGIDDWTRVEMYCNTRNQTQETRLFWGSNLHGPASSPNETLTQSLATVGDFETWGIGLYASSTPPIYFAGCAVGEGTWLGPVNTSRHVHTRGWGNTIKPVSAAA